MISARVLSVVASLSMACASSTELRPRARAASRYVLIDPSALRMRPDASAPALGVHSPRPMAFRRVALRGAWVELETVALPLQQCDPTLAPPEGMRLRFFAPASAVVPTLARPLQSSGAEGSYSAQPGVAVNAQGQIVSAGLTLAPHAELVTATTFRARRVEASSNGASRLREGTRVALPEGATAEVTRDATVLVRSQRRDGAGTRVDVRAPCVRFESVVANESVLPMMDLEIEEHDAPGESATHLARGTRLRWPDGSPAGRASSEVVLEGEARVVGAMRCTRVALRVAGSEPVGVEVCEDAP